MNNLAKNIDRDDLIQSVIDCFEAYSKFEEGYYTECEDNSPADYLGSLFYGEASFNNEIDISEKYMDREALDCINYLRVHIGEEETLQLMRAHSYLLYSNMYLNSDEWLSVSIGEIEYQIDSVESVEGLSEALKACGDLSDSEVENIERWCGISGLRDLIGGSHTFGYMSFGCDRWCLVLEVEDFLDAVKGVLR